MDLRCGNVVILGLVVCAVPAGAWSFTAIAQWAANADQDTLGALRVTGVVPSESTGSGCRPLASPSLVTDGDQAWEDASFSTVRFLFLCWGHGGPASGSQPDHGGTP